MSLIDLKFMGFEAEFNENYDLQSGSIIGKGAIGKVYKVKNKKDNIFYAVKKSEAFTIEEFMLNLNEVFGLLRIGVMKNQHVVNLHQIFAWTSEENLMVLAIVIDYCDGGSLREIITKARKNKKKELDVNVEKMAKDLISGFGKLVTESKLHHRDIKPDNILIKDGKAKICDFNICKLLPPGMALKVNK